MRIKHQLLLTHGILVILSLIIVFINVFAYVGMESDATIINQSGRLRALSYNMGLLANRLNQNTTIEDQTVLESQTQLIKELKTKISEYETIIDNLRNRRIDGIDHKATRVRLEKIILKWEDTYKPLYTSFFDSDTNRDSDLENINSSIDAYVTEVNVMVSDYTAYAHRKVMQAMFMNALLVIVILLVTAYSFTSTNKNVRKPMLTLITELKELSLIDDDVSNRLKNIDTSELSQMSLYFNEMMFDQLTKVYTRRAGLAKLNKLMAQDHRRSLHLSLCFIDINGLKLVNDVLGHKQGDALIVSAVDVIKKQIRDEDYIIRMGGDEFLIVFKDIDEAVSESIWKRINERYASINLNHNRPYVISVSHGIVSYDSSKKSEVDELIKHADDKMYIEKKIIKEDLNFNIIKKPNLTVKKNKH